ncbi:chemotaxis protein MotC [Neorhizobium galegae]|uniref:chemotaxis protein MotC n=1 Tax=Neorhizobium galegae TaxID=399 RepID=UPI001AE40148|nr:chemotaxis protein MotC [Neorhizobium galegae]MBP2548049.1 chemotaxis protein MotC [Neorhizobium galegae]
MRRLAAAFLLAGLPHGALAQQAVDGLQPYQMLRSLQFLQDTVVMGDHSAAEMQRFMLSTIDRALRTADPTVFDDPRNVDAVLIYAMSGGNPATLEFLVSKDVGGNFDTRVADALRKYLAGKGSMIAGGMEKMVPEYRGQRIGPYLALIAGNVTVTKTPQNALAFYDWARLTAPGTIIEEAALRRSIAITVELGMVDKALTYSRQYARRFVFSPYASQFADLFVRLVVSHYGALSDEDVRNALERMDDDRAREIYLRIARQATIDGKAKLAQFASGEAGARGVAISEGDRAVAGLYSGAAKLPNGKVEDASKALADIPDARLSPQDKALRAAAQRVAEEVLRPPVAESFRQDEDANIQNDISGETVSAVSGDERAGKAAAPGKTPGGSAPKLDPAFQTYVDRGRSTLDAIDDLLKGEN